jgi:hypothetical protein
LELCEDEEAEAGELEDESRLAAMAADVETVVGEEDMLEGDVMKEEISIVSVVVEKATD